MLVLRGIHIQNGDGLAAGEHVAAVVLYGLGLCQVCMVNVFEHEVSDEAVEGASLLIEEDFLAAVALRLVVEAYVGLPLQVAGAGGLCIEVCVLGLRVLLDEELHVDACLGEDVLVLGVKKVQLVEAGALGEEVLEGGVCRGVESHVGLRGEGHAVLDGVDCGLAECSGGQVNVGLAALYGDSGGVQLRSDGDLNAVQGIQDHAGGEEHGNGALQPVCHSPVHSFMSFHSSLPSIIKA